MDSFNSFFSDFFYIRYELVLLLASCHLICLHLSTKFTSLRFTNMDYIFASILFTLVLMQISLDRLDVCFGTTYVFHNHIIYNYYIKLMKTAMAAYLFIYLWFTRIFSEMITIPLVEFLSLIFLAFFSLSMVVSSNHM